MDPVTHQRWWLLYFRVARGELLTSEERTFYEEGLRLIDGMWDDLASETEQFTVPDWQKDELDRRKAHALENPGSGRSWEEVKERILARHQVM